MRASELGLRFGRAGLGKAAVALPFCEVAGERRIVVEKRLTEIEDLEVVDDDDGGWRVEWKGPE